MVYNNQIGIIEGASRVRMFIIAMISSIILALGLFTSAYATNDEPMTSQVNQAADACDANYFPDYNMWEITWGMQYSDTNGAPTFTHESYGGLVTINDQVTTWTDPHLYVTEANVQNGRTITYGFADGTVITAVVTADQNGCPAVEWTTVLPGTVARTKVECKNAGWVAFSADYKNQGQCIAAVQSSEKSKHNR